MQRESNAEREQCTERAMHSESSERATERERERAMQREQCTEYMESSTQRAVHRGTNAWRERESNAQRVHGERAERDQCMEFKRVMIILPTAGHDLCS